MKQPSANSLALSARCQHFTSTGRQCRLSVSDAHSGLCPHHHAQQKQKEAADVSAILTRDCRGFQTAQGINHSMSDLYLLLAENRISPRRAAVLAYIGNLLLRTLAAIDADNEAGVTLNSPTSDFPGSEPDPTKKPS